MRILVIASFNKGSFAPFIVEQVEALKKLGCIVDFFGLQGKGFQGYLRNLPLLVPTGETSLRKIITDNSNPNYTKMFIEVLFISAKNGKQFIFKTTGEW